MTTDRLEHPAGQTPEGPAAVLPPDELLAAGHRRARQRTLSGRADERQRARRRILPAALAGASVLALAGAADRFVAGTVPASTTTATAVAGPAPTTGAVPAATLNQIAQTLAADRQAIAALAQAQAQLAGKAGEDGGSGASVPAVSLPSLPSLPSASSLAVPPAAAPATHATTGASVVVP